VTADCIIGAANGVAKERLIAIGCVVDAGGVAIERLKTGGRVVDAGRQANERLNIFRC
jgi:hypothetical protein